MNLLAAQSFHIFLECAVDKVESPKCVIKLVGLVMLTKRPTYPFLNCPAKPALLVVATLVSGVDVTVSTYTRGIFLAIFYLHII